MMADDRASTRQAAASGAEGTPGGASVEPDFATAAGLSRDERTVVRRLSKVLRFNDFMTVMMVIATIFSAFATWRTAQVTNLLFAIEERPYIGVERVTVDSIDADFARVMIDCRNFGSVSANDGVAQVSVTIDDATLPETTPTAGIQNIVIVSPTVPHRIFRFVPKALYEQVREGHSRMIVHIVFNYRGPDQRQFCYSEMMGYDRRTADFISIGGSDRCNGQIY
jgi:ATP-dependent Clp protease adapter protein ClpS